MNKKNSIYTLSMCALFTALMCIFGPMSVPIGPVPVSLTNLVIYVAIFLLGTKGTSISYIVYLLLAVVGLPVLSGYSGGLAKLAGATGGYLIGFILMIVIAGLAFELSKGNIPITAIGMIFGTIVAYAFGTIWFVFVVKVELSYALTVCVYPFIPFDLGKIAIACILGTAVRGALIKANLIDGFKKNTKDTADNE